MGAADTRGQTDPALVEAGPIGDMSTRPGTALETSELGVSGMLSVQILILESFWSGSQLLGWEYEMPRAQRVP